MGPQRAVGAGLDAELDRAVPTETAVAFLLALGGSQPGRVHPLARNTTFIGRSDRSEIRLLHPSVSAEHARIINGSGGFEIHDLGSTNGTYVNGRLVARARLQGGDQITIGSVEFTFLLDQALENTVALLPPGARPMLGTLAQQPVRMLGPMSLYGDPHVGVPGQGAAFPGPYAGHPGMSPSAPVAEPGDGATTLADLLRKVIVVKRFLQPHLRLIVLLCLLGVTAGVASVVWLPPAPAAVCETKLNPSKKSNPVEGWRPPEAEAQQFFAEAGRSFSQPELVRSTLRTLEGQDPSEAKVTAVRRRLTLEPITERIYKATYREPLLGRGEPEALAFLKAHVQNYLHTEIDRTLRVFSEEAEFLQKKLGAAEADLLRINAALADFKKQNADRLPENTGQAHSSRFSLESRRGELAAQVARLEGEIAVDERQLSEESPLAQTRMQSSQVYRESLAALNRKLSEAYARGLADGHPDVMQIRNERSRVEKLIEQEMKAESTQMDRLANAGYAGLKSRLEMSRAQLRAARTELREVDRNLGQLRSMVVSAPGVAARLDDLQREHAATKRLHDQLSDQAQKANLQVDIERLAARSRYEMLIAPQLVKPSRRVSFGGRAALGLAVALMLAATIVAWREGRRALARTLASIEERS